MYAHEPRLGFTASHYGLESLPFFLMLGKKRSGHGNVEVAREVAWQLRAMLYFNGCLVEIDEDGSRVMVT